MQGKNILTLQYLCKLQKDSPQKGSNNWHAVCHSIGEKVTVDCQSTFGGRMKVTREKPCQRRYHRVSAPLKITAESGRTCTAADWSLGGVRIVSWTDELPENDQILPLTLHLPFQGFDIAFEVEARVVHIIDEQNSFAAEFLELPERARDLMTHFIDDLIRGKMASVEDTICRIDVPVTPISTQPDVNQQEETGLRRWPLKTIIMSAAYMVVGFFVFSYAAVLLYATAMKLEVKTAVVSAPLSTLRMPVDGRIIPVRYEVGLHLRKGDLIARISSPVIDARIEDARLQVRQARHALWQAEQKARIEKARMKLYQLVSETDLEVSIAKVKAQRKVLQAADTHFARMTELATSGYATKTELEDAVLRQAMAAAALKQAELEHSQAIAMKTISKRRHYNHKVFVADLDLVEVAVSQARSKLEIELAELSNLERQKAQTVIKAPNDGYVVAVFQPPDTAVDRNAPLLTIEQTSQLSVTAFLSQDEVLEVGLQDKASIYVPALDQLVEATVSAVDRNASAIDPNAQHYSWQEADRRSAVVSLKIDANTIAAQQMSAGLPAVVVFNRRATSELHARIGALFSALRESSNGLGI
ncbi:PilZ domain-containing protein [Coralliovum pocilloporae]|uniref:PilZ domain-containing protein n=1 Tax=Coralliovum pocilloporae TaxID=3066369 RepID=UPI0033073C8A